MNWLGNTLIVRLKGDRGLTVFDIQPNGVLWISGDGWKKDRKIKFDYPTCQTGPLGSEETARQIAENLINYIGLAPPTKP